MLQFLEVRKYDIPKMSIERKKKKIQNIKSFRLLLWAKVGEEISTIYYGYRLRSAHCREFLFTTY